MNILYLLPGLSDVEYEKQIETRLKSFAGNEVQVCVEGVLPDKPPAFGNGHYPEHWNGCSWLVLGNMLSRIHQSPEMDAVVVGCNIDVGVQEARELVGIPVIGILEATVHAAAMLGHTFSVLANHNNFVPKIIGKVRAYGLEGRLASVRSVSLSVSEMRHPESHNSKRENIKNNIREVILEMINEDGAEVVVTGCGTLGEYFAELQDEVPVPILDSRLVGFAAGLYFANLYKCGIARHSKVGLYEGTLKPD